MKRFAAPEFWANYNRLPQVVRELADKKFELLKTEPRHPSLRLKKVRQFWSVRIGLHYRALAKERPEGLVWFWIGSHDAYDKYK
ncbi:MAG TPA: hypothetical protein VEP30_01455 [Chthoniobacterales bacterium]|nr:hypothetical protein [Chthoniobacterales bacterium]